MLMAKPTQEIVLYSCVINHRDDPKPIDIHDGFRHVLFSDDPNIVATGWEVRPPVWTSPDPVRTSRYHKHHPFDLFPKAEYAIWLDMTHWQYESIRPLLTDKHLTMHRHHQRSTAKDEADKCASYNFDKPDILKSQVTHYINEGFPDNVGLYITSCLIMRNTLDYIKFSEMWWEEICRWSKRDQVSLPYCIWRTGITLGVIPGVDRNGHSPYFRIKSHSCIK